MREKVFFAVSLYVTFLVADRGEFSLTPNVQIFEPMQRAMIAWNGEKEILLLSTDLSAAESTLVLEVMPLPAEPIVKKGSLETFEKAVKLINRWLAMHARKDGGRNGGHGGNGKTPPPGEVTFHERIGAHDVSVTHVKSGENFVTWVNNYLDSLGYAFEKTVITDEIKKLIEDYIEDNFEWFVFDIIALGKETRTNEPIQYQFKTGKLFYPLRISRTAVGNTSIELLVLTPRLLKHFSGIPFKMIELAHEPVPITDEELRSLDEDMCELLSGNEEMKLRIWNIQGEPSSFKEDLIAY